MPTAVSSLCKTTIAIAGAGVIAVSPIVPTHDMRVPTVSLPSIELSALPVPAIGAIPYQIGVNAIGNLLAATPVLLGSTEQCYACLGPNPAFLPESPFTGWGLIGIGAGLISSPLVFFGVVGDGSVSKALGAALLAIQVPIQNTLNLLAAPRSIGGFELQAVLDRAFAATKHAVDYLVNITAQALVTGPLTVLAGAVEGATTFAATLAETGDFVTAFNAGRVPFRNSVNTALTDLTAEVQEARSTIYADLTNGPGAATSPIPTLPPPPVASTRAAAAESAGGPITNKVTESPKAVPGTTAGDNEGATASDDTDQSSAPAPKARKATGSNKRQRQSESAS